MFAFMFICVGMCVYLHILVSEIMHVVLKIIIQRVGDKDPALKHQGEIVILCIRGC